MVEDTGRQREHAEGSLAQHGRDHPVGEAWGNKAPGLPMHGIHDAGQQQCEIVASGPKPGSGELGVDAEPTRQHGAGRIVPQRQVDGIDVGG